MDIKQLRQTLKLKWLSYCEENRSWLIKMRIWRTYDGVRRPSSGYILATLSVLEPRLHELLPFLLELNNDPDQIVAALGLNFNPDEELRLWQLENSQAKNQIVNKTPIYVADADTQIKQDSHSNFAQEKKQVLLRIVPSVEQKHQSVSVVTIRKSVNHHSHFAREKISKQAEISEIGRSPTITTQSITTQSISPQSISPQIPITYQFTGIPVKEISYISATTNARSLPAWMDEFCPGVK